MEVPCSSRKKNFLTNYGRSCYSSRKRQDYRSDFANCRSPLNMGEEDANLFLNYWNLNQTFFLKGKTTVAHFENFKVVLAKRSLHATIVEDSGPLSINILNIEKSKQEMKDLKVYES